MAQPYLETSGSGNALRVRLKGRQPATKQPAAKQPATKQAPQQPTAKATAKRQPRRP